MYTLGIETSCDETSCAVLKNQHEVLSNIISSSLFRHKPYGGIVPEIASRHSLEQIDTVLKEALDEAKIKITDIDLIAVTSGPGLIGSLLVGVSFAKALAMQLKKPIVGVNHLEAHLSACFIGKPETEKYVGLLISGGHSMITYQEKAKISVLGSTIDDAIGEAYDKVAKILGLGYPGGPIMDKLAKEGNPKAFQFTRPKQKGEFDFSFSGIKTAVLYEVQKLKGEKPSDQFVKDMAASFQHTVIRWVTDKSLAAAQEKNVKLLVVGGGVSANSYLRELLPAEGKKIGIDVWFPEFKMSLDNAAMIARRGWEIYKAGHRDTLALSGTPSLKVGV